jgi:hypothetical protein
MKKIKALNDVHLDGESSGGTKGEGDEEPTSSESSSSSEESK